MTRTRRLSTKVLLAGFLWMPTAPAFVIGSLNNILPALPAADNWPEFRGPAGNGHSDSVGLPREWSETRNVVWKTPIHGRGWSSPVVWGKQVWLTTATPEGKELYAVCVERESGKVSFDLKLFEVAKPEDTRQYNSFASPTPVIEEGRVYVHFGSYGTACLKSGTGEILWSRRDLPCNHWRGPGSSPILFQDLLILHFDGYDFQYIAALDKGTGKTIWKVDRSHEYGTEDGDMKKAFSTPAVIEVGGRPQLISPAAKAVLAYEPLTGKEIWQVRYPNHSAAARPLFGHGLVYINTGFSKAELIAIRPDGKGDVTGTSVAWKSSKGIGSKPSPVMVEDLIYSVSDNGGVACCLEAKTGSEVWKERIGGKAHSASPVHAGGAIYFFAEDGTSVAIQPGRELKELAKGKLDGEFMASPAIAGKAFFLRSDSHLCRVEER